MFKILIDSREQRPWIFPRGVRTKLCTLRTGDYSIYGLSSQFAIERKSWSDFLVCISASRKRFHDQIKRLAGLPHGLVMVEGTPALSLPGRYHGDRLPYGSVLARVARLVLASPVPIVFCSNRKEATDVALQICKEIYAERNELPVDSLVASRNRRFLEVPEVLSVAARR